MAAGGRINEPAPAALVQVILADSGPNLPGAGLVSGF
jgi:hypothetical protein